MSSDWKMNERDTQQRSLGSLGFSMLLHTGLLVTLLFAPKVTRKVEELLPSGRGGQIEMVDDKSPGSASAGSPSVHEVLLADASDINAVSLPKPTEPAPQPAPKIEPNVAPNIVTELPEKTAETTPEPEAKPEILTDAQAEVKIETPPPAPKTEPPPAIKKLQVAVMAKPKIHTLPKKHTPRAKPIRAPMEAPPEEVKEREAVAEQTPAPTPQEELTKDEAKENAKDDAKDESFQPAAVADLAPESKEAESLSPEISDAPPMRESAPEIAAGNANGSTNANSQGTGPAQAPHGTGDGFGSPFATGNAMDASLRHPLPGNPKAVYPLADRMNGRQGSAIIVAQVRADGSVGAIGLKKKSGSELMDRAAVEAFRKWKFAPGPEVLVLQPFDFRLVGEAEIAHTRLGGR